MKVAILAGGYGSRLQEETVVRPKPLVEIGGRPILWHIMSIYSTFGFNDFSLALGYKGESIKEYFLNFYALNNDITVNLAHGKTHIHQGKQPIWNIDLVDTGQNTMTGGRLKRLQPWLDNKRFFATYGDGVANISITDLLAFHKSHGKIATLSAVRPPARFGGLRIKPGGEVVEFVEKPQGGEGWINGGFFVFEPAIFDYIAGDSTPLELDPMEKLAKEGELMAFQHDGFFQPMDTLRDRHSLETLWESGKAPWKMWD